MKLQTKLVLILGATMGTVVLALGSLSTWILLDRMGHVEQVRAARNVERAVNALHAQIEELNTKTSDWAFWDDTVRFMRDQNPEFIKSNIAPSTFQTLLLDAIAFVDPQGKLVYGRQFNPASNTLEDLGPALRELLRPGSIVLKPRAEQKSISGLLLVDDLPVMFATRPILDSQMSGPPRGTLTWIRYLHDHDLAALARQTHLTLELLAPAEGRGAENGPTVASASEELIHGYALLRNVYGQPILTLRTTEERNISAAARASAWRLMVALVATGASIAALAIVLLRRFVLARLARLEQQVRGIGTAEDFSGRVDVGGDDELATLACSMNHMLDSLRGAKQLADAAARAKSEFLANMSHEIRTPMTAILGFAELLAVADLSTDERLEITSTIRRNGQHLMQIINDVLDLSKIEAGRAIIERSDCSPRELIDDVVCTLRGQAAGKGLSLEVNCITPPPQRIRTDATRLRQVMLNLVGNALKFTDQGGVTIELQTIESPSGPRLRFLVIDTGIGIKPQQQIRIFNAFEQADSSTTRKFGGTGLGLPISRRFVQMLGGDLKVCSEFGKGSTFCFDLPIEADRAEPRSIRGSTESKGPIAITPTQPPDRATAAA